MKKLVVLVIMFLSFMIGCEESVTVTSSGSKGNEDVVKVVTEEKDQIEEQDSSQIEEEIRNISENDTENNNDGSHNDIITREITELNYKFNFFIFWQLFGESDDYMTKNTFGPFSMDLVGKTLDEVISIHGEPDYIYDGIENSGGFFAMPYLAYGDYRVVYKIDEPSSIPKVYEIWGMFDQDEGIIWKDMDAIFWWI